MNEIIKMNLRQLMDGLLKKQFTSCEVTTAYLERIAAVDGDVCGFITATPELAMDAAKKADQLIMANTPTSPLCGIPFAVKDNICTKGISTTCASAMLEDFVSPYDATVVEKLKNSGMVLLGKTNMDEFGMGSTGENSYFKTTKNPLNPLYSPGGSSSGSAAVVASLQAPVALGSDTGGSVRLPASFCGLVGMKPTYGRLSRYGLISFAPSLDQIGVISKNVYDNAVITALASGYDKRDARSIQADHPSYISEIDKGVSGLTVAIPEDLDKMEVSTDAVSAVYKTASLLRELGANIITCKLPDKDTLISCYYVLSCAEASSNLARFDGVRYGRRMGEGSDEAMYVQTRSRGFGCEVKKRIMLGSFILSHGYYDKYYLTAMKHKQHITNQYGSILKSCHAILTPTSPFTVSLLNQSKTSLDRYKGDVFNVGANVSGLPAITLPVAKDENGMPIGVSFMGGYMNEHILYRIASSVEGGLT